MILLTDNENIQPLSPENLLLKLEENGVSIVEKDVRRDIKTVKRIGYYKLKEIAQYYVLEKNEKISFENLLERYYCDKQLRMNTLHAIEDIEIYLHNCIGELLGNKYGPFGYLDFKNWCDKAKFNKNEVKEDEHKFKKKLAKKAKKSRMPDLKEQKNLNSKSYPTVWLAMEVLTLGELVFLYRRMSVKNKKIIATKFNTNQTELLSWLECLNLIRNICCHNSNLVNIKLTTKPKIPNKYKKYLYFFDKKETNRLALTLVVIKRMMESVNPKYDYTKLNKTLSNLIKRQEDKIDNLTKDKNAQLLGFNKASDINKIFPKRNPRSKRRSKRKKNYSKYTKKVSRR